MHCDTSAEAFTLALDEVYVYVLVYVLQRPEEGRCVLISECDFLFFSVLLQPISDREGKRCMFCVKTSNKTFEMSASDQKQKVEWIQGLSLCMTFTFGGACYRITNVGT